jgi:hypothetical protein
MYHCVVGALPPLEKILPVFAVPQMFINGNIFSFLNQNLSHVSIKLIFHITTNSKLIFIHTKYVRFCTFHDENIRRTSWYKCMCVLVVTRLYMQIDHTFHGKVILISTAILLVKTIKTSTTLNTE